MKKAFRIVRIVLSLTAAGLVLLFGGLALAEPVIIAPVFGILAILFLALAWMVWPRKTKVVYVQQAPPPE